MSRKLTYFEIPGFGETIRYLLHYGGLKFEDFRYQRKDWPIKEIKDTLPYGQFPIYEENGQTINQSMAIARYVASQVGLLPSDPWEQAKLDAAVLNLYEFYGKLMTTQRSDLEEEKKKALVEETIAFYYPRFERDLKAGNGHFGGKLSWADFVLAGGTVGINIFFGSKLEKDFPAITALVTEIQNLKGVKEYIATQSYAENL
ncbi:hypothetical protein ABMA27_001598 [Loxostege sticticalis]|uniref:glutathione transferase n=1 Tax=Loxostege sticticalis TaxID=481309 RepID=A0ABR3HZ52_LOXSC